ncbi:MAG: hypothetical protein JWN63_498 [Candidatus Acidoferrum typicum]|nr:hypothetical protein [Candidatus Acidoferrum typicum]
MRGTGPWPIIITSGFLRLVEEEKGRMSELAAHQPKPELIYWPSGNQEYTPICLHLRRVARTMNPKTKVIG